jgi:hypothetical protein
MSELDEWFPRESGEWGAPTGSPQTLTPQEIKAKGESKTRDYMAKLCGIYLRKRSDAPIKTPDGRTIQVYSGVDYHGSVKIPGSPFAARVEVEVKTFSESFQFSEIKPHQVTAMDEARERGELVMVSLVEHIRGNIFKMFWIPWPSAGFGKYREWEHSPLGSHWEKYKTLAWVRCELRDRIAGNYQAKSIRAQDHDLLQDFLVDKSGKGGTWQLSESHWLRGLLDIPVGQPRLL